MTVMFYNTNSDPRVINKVLTDKKSVGSVYLKDGTDVLRPSLKLKNVNHKNYNYCYIQDFDRYYFIRNWSKQFGGTTVIDCEVDV